MDWAGYRRGEALITDRLSGVVGDAFFAMLGRPTGWPPVPCSRGEQSDIEEHGGQQAERGRGAVDDAFQALAEVLR